MSDTTEGSAPAATDEHNDWVSSTLGIDPKSYESAAAAPAPAASEPASDSSSSGVLSTVGGWFSDAASTVGDAAASVGNAVVDTAQTVGGAVVDAAETVGGAVEGAAETVGGAVVDTAETVGGAVVGAAETVGGAVVDTAETVGGAVVGAAETVGGAVVDAAETVGSALVDTAETVGGAVADTAVGAAKAVAGVASDAVDTVEDWFDAGPKAAKVKDTTDKVTKMSDADLKKLSPADKVQMVKDLLGNGKPSKEARAAQRKVYQAMELDPDFMKRDEARGKQIADDLKGDKDLEKARDGWGATNEKDKVAALKKVVEAQSKRLGIPPPEIVIEHNPPEGGLITNGYFDPSDGKLHLNMDPASSIHDFEKAVDLSVHENAHNYQDHLVKDLKSGKIKPGDPDYTQATMFEVNDLPNGYVDGHEDYATYQKQPFEDHSWHTGPATAKKILKSL
jgi:hypothetical protein